MFRFALLIVCAVCASPTFAADPEPVRGDSLYFAQDFSGALKEFQKFVKKNPGHARTWYRLAFSELKTEKFADADKHFRKADSLGFNRAYTNYNWACALAELNKLDAAFEKLELGLQNGYPVTALDSEPNLKNLRTSASWPTLRETLNRYVEPCNYNPMAREFDFWLGTWDVFHPVSGVKVGVNTIVKEENGCFLHESWRSETGVTGQSINFWDPVDSLWHQTWVDRFGGQLVYHGRMRDGVMWLEGRNYEPGKPSAAARMILTPMPDGSVDQLMEQANENGEWTEVFHGIYRKTSQ